MGMTINEIINRLNITKEKESLNSKEEYSTFSKSEIQKTKGEI